MYTYGQSYIPYILHKPGIRVMQLILGKLRILGPIWVT